jgi:hypothetical protein
MKSTSNSFLFFFVFMITNLNNIYW